MDSMPRKMTVAASLALPAEVHLALKALAIARAKQNGGLPPTFRALVMEAVEDLLRREHNA